MAYLKLINPEILTEWEFFVWRHQSKGNLIMHFISFLSSFIVIGLAFYSKNYWLFFGVLPAQYIGYLGHIIFKEGQVRNKDFISPMTTIHLFKIFTLVALRKYAQEIKRVKNKIVTHQNSL